MNGFMSRKVLRIIALVTGIVFLLGAVAIAGVSFF